MRWRHLHVCARRPWKPGRGSQSPRVFLVETNDQREWRRVCERDLRSGRSETSSFGPTVQSASVQSHPTPHRSFSGHSKVLVLSKAFLWSIISQIWRWYVSICSASILHTTSERSKKTIGHIHLQGCDLGRSTLQNPFESWVSPSKSPYLFYTSIASTSSMGFDRRFFGRKTFFPSPNIPIHPQLQLLGFSGRCSCHPWWRSWGSVVSAHDPARVATWMGSTAEQTAVERHERSAPVTAPTARREAWNPRIFVTEILRVHNSW